MSRFILLKGLHFVKTFNTIIAFSLQKSKYAPERYQGNTLCFPRFFDEYRGKVRGFPGEVGTV